MFVRLLPLILVSFIRSISYVISAFLTFRLGRAWLNSRRGSRSRSVAAIVERRFYNESLYLGKRLRLPHCASRNCCSLSLRAKCSGDRGRSNRCCFKGVLRFIAGRPATESNAFAEYFRSYEMRIVWEKIAGRRKSVLSPGRPYFSFRSINVFLNLTSFFEIYPCSRSCSLLRFHFLRFPISSFSFSSPRRDLGIRFSFPLQFPLVRGHFLLFTSLSVHPFSVRCSFSFCRYLRRRRSSWISFSLAICSPLFKVGR